RGIIEKVVMDLMYDIPTDEYIEKCVITEEVVTDGADPIISYSDKPRTKKNNFRRHIRTSSADSIA
ncbi:MAG: ATP-dependent Clp protease ATP-binding subunit ClpX, partial [Lachnospiraceae bacterium]|nr:ATP-dependent Clp protease ATP-binding subunit ClpX [Lachnospiraceae bacterium]